MTDSDDFEIQAMIDNAGHIGENPRPEWSESVQVIQQIINLRCDRILMEFGRSREAHDEVSEIQRHWARILQG